MPWQTKELINLVNEAENLIIEFYSLPVHTNVFIVTQEEMIEVVLNEQQSMNRSPQELEKIRFELKYILGRYFSSRNEIWLVDEKGVVLDVLIHEFLYSLQLCKPHREHIVDYLTYKLTSNSNYISSSVLHDWQEIEKNFKLKKILERLRKVGDCEDFE